MAKGVLFRLAPLLAFFILLAVIESALRLAGYGRDGAYLRERDIGGVPHLVADRSGFRAFFPPNLLPSLEPLAVPVRKQALRVVVLGESAALGTPDPAFGFPRILERMLAHRYPDLPFEVINLSATAINSHVLADLTPRLAPLQPDFVVIYAGNNEVVGPYGPGTVFAPFLADIRLVKAGILLGRTRTGQLLLDLWRKAAWQLHPPERWAGLEMFRERAIAPGAPCLAPVYRHFRGNVTAMVASARGLGAQVILSTVASKLRGFAPLASLPPRDSASGLGGLATAEARYLRGLDHLAAGRRAEAARDLIAARDLDALRLRADSRINAILRETVAGAGPGVRLVDAEAAFAAADRQGLPGHDLFYEHVHMTFAGNHLLARVVLAAVDTSLLALGRIAAVPSDEPLDEEACRRGLGLTGWDRLGMAERILDLLSRPPFSGRPGADVERAAARRRVDSLAAYGGAPLAPEVLEEYRQALETFPEDPVVRRNHGEYLEALGLPAEAAAELSRVLAALPQDARSRQLLARALASQGRLPEAAREYRAALAEDPWLPELRNGLGNLLVRQGDHRGAIGQYRLALQVQPHLPEIHYNLGRAYAGLSRPEEAARAWRQALALDPGFQPAAKALQTP